MDEYVTQLEGVLSNILTANNSQAVKAATEELHKVWYKRGETVLALFKILQIHPQPQMRQLSGVEVRKLLHRYWYDSENSLGSEMLEQIKASLLSDSLKEESDLVRHTVARIISTIARIDLDENRWPQLLPELRRAATSSDVKEREIATYVFYALLDSADYCAAASADAKGLMQLFSSTIKDPESLPVRVNTVLALCGLSSTMGGAEAQYFQQFVPEIVNVLKQTVDANDEKSSNQIFESLSELVDGDAMLLGPAFGELLAHMINEYGLNKHIDPETRVAAMRVVATAASYRYNRINKLKLGPELTKKLVEVVVASESEQDGDNGGDEEDDDDDEITTEQHALQALEVLAARLPPSQVIAPLLQILPSLVHTSDPAHLRAGYLAFSVTADGAPDFVSSESKTLLPWIVQGLQNTHQGVRVAALNALVQLGEGVGDNIGKEHATLVPLVYSILDSAPSLKVCRSACVALATIMRTLKNEVLTTEYLPGLVPRLLEVVRTADNLDLKGFVISTLGTAAEVAGRNFMPYFQESISALEPYLAVPQPDPATNEITPAQAKLVSEALGTLSRFCCAVGSEHFAPYLDGWMKTALICLHSEDAILREMAPLYISELAEVYKADFGVYVPHILPHLFEVLDQEEITFEDIPGLGGDDAADIDIENMDATDLNDGLKVNSALCIEKEFSLDCLGSIWQYVPAEPTLMPYLEDSLTKLVGQSEHFYEEVRMSAITGLWRMFQSLPNNPEIKAAVWSATSTVFETESEMSIVSSVFDLIGETLSTNGASIFPNEEAIQHVFTNVLDIILKTHRVFDEFEDEEPEDEKENAGEESSEASTQLVQTSFELLSRIARVLGSQFTQLFEEVAKALQPYAASQMPIERENGVGAFADLVGAMESNITPWTSALLTAFLSALDDQVIAVRSVAAYGIGLLAQNSTNDQEVKQAYPSIFEKLARLLSDGGDDRAVANGAGAVARLATRHPDAVPLSASDLAQQLTTVLPLKDAYEEYPPILSFLSTTQLPASAKPLIEALWQEHVEAQQKDAVKSVNYLPAADPLGDDVSMQAWRVCAQQLGVQV